jgi:hypothetical protein
MNAVSNINRSILPGKTNWKFILLWFLCGGVQKISSNSEIKTWTTSMFFILYNYLLKNQSFFYFPLFVYGNVTNSKFDRQYFPAILSMKNKQRDFFLLDWDRRSFNRNIHLFHRFPSQNVCSKFLFTESIVQS